MLFKKKYFDYRALRPLLFTNARPPSCIYFLMNKLSVNDEFHGLTLAERQLNLSELIALFETNLS